VVYVNSTKAQAVWRHLLDYWVNWDCDEWVKDLDQRLFTSRMKHEIE
jgi:NAD-dependent histone deacetylase SIR2